MMNQVDYKRHSTALPCESSLRARAGLEPGASRCRTLLSGTSGLVLALLVLLSHARPLFSSAKDYTVQEVAPGIFVWVPEDIIDQDGDPRFSRAANAGFIVSDQGVVVIDTTNSPLHAREFLYEIRQRSDIPVRFAIDTGPQGDEVLGNEVFAEQRAAIISTAGAAAQMQRYEKEMNHLVTFDTLLSLRMRGVHMTLPDRTFDGAMSFSIGGQEIRVLSLHCALPGKTEGDAAVFLPDAKVAFLGDLYVNGYVPRIGSLDIRRWVAVLGEVEKWNAAVYVPAHGRPGGKADLERFRGFLEWLQGRVAGGIREGKSLTQVERELLDTQALYLRAPELAPSTIASVYRQLATSENGRSSRAVATPATPAWNERGALLPGGEASGPGRQGTRPARQLPIGSAPALSRNSTSSRQPHPAPVTIN
jgi:glyoxylase-like metal-dependent hydrolase (beta-lactamase superfamily II)